MTYAKLSLVVQLSTMLVSSHEVTSASASTTGVPDTSHFTMVSALSAMRVAAAVVVPSSRELAEIDLLVVPSVMPQPKYAGTAGRSASVSALPASASCDAVAWNVPVAAAVACVLYVISSVTPLVPVMSL